MEKIGNLLGRFKNIGIPNETARNYVAEAIYSELGEKIDFKNISIRNGVAYVKCDSSAKSEIFIQKEKILKAIQKKEGERPVVFDIR